MIRESQLYNDIQKVIVGLVQAKIDATAPWSYWQINENWPTGDVFENFTTPFIYILPPEATKLNYRYGGGNYKYFTLTFGIWNNVKTGGPKENNIMASAILAFFGCGRTTHTQQFDVTLASAFTNTTLIAQGLRVTHIHDRGDMYTEDDDQFRKEFVLTLRVHV